MNNKVADQSAQVCRLSAPLFVTSPRIQVFSPLSKCNTNFSVHECIGLFGEKVWVCENLFLVATCMVTKSFNNQSCNLQGYTFHILVAMVCAKVQVIFFGMKYFF